MLKLEGAMELTSLKYLILQTQFHSTFDSELALGWLLGSKMGKCRLEEVL